MPLQYQEDLKEDLRNNKTIILGCNCAIRYSGRAESFLDYNDCTVLIKADNTVLVHQPTGNNPINYMKPGTQFSIHEKNDQLHIKAQHPGLKEYMDIEIGIIYFYQSYKLEQGGGLVLEGTEKDMADMILKNPSCIEEGFKPVSQEEQTKYGFIDVFGYDSKGTLCVVECKRYTGDFKAVDQLRRYVEKIKASKGIDNVRGILACPSITPNALAMLQDFGFSHSVVEPPKRLDRFKKNQSVLTQF